MLITKKLIMKKTILVFLIMLTAWKINAQQDPQYTQYMYNMNVINPAYAGSSDATSIGVLSVSYTHLTLPTKRIV